MLSGLSISLPPDDLLKANPTDRREAFIVEANRRAGQENQGTKALWVLWFAGSKRRLKEYPRLPCGSLGCDLRKLQFKYRTFYGRAESFSGLADPLEAGGAHGSQDSLRKMPDQCFIYTL